MGSPIGSKFGASPNSFVLGLEMLSQPNWALTLNPSEPNKSGDVYHPN